MMHGFVVLLAWIVSGQELQSPDDTAANCGPDVMRQATNNKPCAQGFMGAPHTRMPEPECCMLMADYYGPDSALGSANCFCDPDAWNELLDTTLVAHMDWATFFGMCNSIGAYIPYFSEEGGMCNGTIPQLVTDKKAAWQASWAVAEGFPAALPSRSAAEYFANMKNDPLLVVAFTMTILSGLGFLVCLWPIAYDGFWTVVDGASCMCKKRISCL